MTRSVPKPEIFINDANEEHLRGRIMTTTGNNTSRAVHFHHENNVNNVLWNL